MMEKNNLGFADNYQNFNTSWSWSVWKPSVQLKYHFKTDNKKDVELWLFGDVISNVPANGNFRVKLLNAVWLDWYNGSSWLYLPEEF